MQPVFLRLSNFNSTRVPLRNKQVHVILPSSLIAPISCSRAHPVSVCGPPVQGWGFQSDSKALFGSSPSCADCLWGSGPTTGINATARICSQRFQEGNGQQGSTQITNHTPDYRESANAMGEAPRARGCVNAVGSSLHVLIQLSEVRGSSNPIRLHLRC